ncbi:hypothetical protein ACWD26_40335 [Streptomyces sp. NPDC002787]
MPIERDDENNCAPLADLKLPEQPRWSAGPASVGTERGLQNQKPESIERVLRVRRDLELTAPAD